MAPTPPYPRSTTIRMVGTSSFGNGNFGGMFGGQKPSKVLKRGQEVLKETAAIIVDVGVEATVRRTLIGQKALFDTSLELLRELPAPTTTGGGVGSSSAGAAARAFELLSLPRKLLEGDTEFLTQYVASLPADVAPRTLRKLFERLGATYVKLGQFIASSPTLFPPEYVLEFQKCLDDTPRTEFSVVKQTVERELGRPISEVFSRFEETPLASASIAQVHAATLRSSGADVVVKVQKPGVSQVLKADLGFLAVTASVLELLAPSLGRLSLANVVGDLRLSMLEELDFELEAKNLVEFGEFLSANSLYGIATSPRPYLEASSKKVLTMERLRGVPLSDLEGIRAFMADNEERPLFTPEQTLINALNTWTLSVVAGPFFHADVHAGNLLVLEDGRVGFIDFGIVGRIPKRIFQSIQDLAQALTVGSGQVDYSRVASALVEMGAADLGQGEAGSTVDVAAFAEDLRRAATQLDATLSPLEVQVQAVQGVDGRVEALGAQLGGVDEEQVARLALEVVGVAERNGVKLPREFGILLKQVLYFDRYTRLLAPGLDVLADDRLEMQPRRTPDSGGVVDV